MIGRICVVTFSTTEIPFFENSVIWDMEENIQSTTIESTVVNNFNEI